MSVRRLVLAVWCVWACASEAQMSLRQALGQRRGAAAETAAVEAAGALPKDVSEALAAAVSRAGVIFLGDVTAVEHEGGSVRVRFHVESAVRGTVAGETYTMREWAGLWTNGGTRYRKGQRMLVLLHAPSAAGFTSPVGGAEGLLPLRGDGVSGQLDLRWLEVGIARKPLTAPERAAGMQGKSEAPIARAQAMAAEPAAAPAPSAQPETLDCALLMDMVRSLATRSSPQVR